MSDEHAQAQAVLEVKEQEVSLLDQIITETRIGRDDEQRAQSRQQIAALVDEVLQGTVTISSARAYLPIARGGR